MNFAAIQQRVNSAVAAKLMTDFGLLNGLEISGKFDNASASAFSGGLLGTNPVFTCLAADSASPVLTWYAYFFEAPIPGQPSWNESRNRILEINLERYKVREAKPDATGLIILELEKL